MGIALIVVGCTLTAWLLGQALRRGKITLCPWCGTAHHSDVCPRCGGVA